ncbi:MAG TPA: hypothetical protein VIJ57_12650 [Hanamia sp.]
MLFAFLILFSFHAVGQNEYQADWKSLDNYKVPEWFKVTGRRWIDDKDSKNFSFKICRGV